MRKPYHSSHSPFPSIIRQALSLNKHPFPWIKALCAGLAASLPVIIGLLFGNLKYGLIAGLGGFTYLYVFQIPYAQRAKKIFLVLLGITFVSLLGSLAAPYPILIAIFMGVISATAVFIFGALKIKGPSALFFVLVFAMTAAMPIQPELTLVRTNLIFLGGALSWLIAMIGWFFDPHGPETRVVKKAYIQLASLLDSVGTQNFNDEKHKVMAALKDAEETLAAGYLPWRKTDIYNRLIVCNDHANSIFLHVIENFSSNKKKLLPEIGDLLREIAESLDQKKKGNHIHKKIILPEDMNHSVIQLVSKITDADAIMNEPISKINEEIHISKYSFKSALMEAFDKNSIVFITAVQFGIVTTIAAMIAYLAAFTRPFWVPISCVAVMSGFTIIATYHRAIQRAFGTIFGILIAGLIFAVHPTGYMIAGLILLLTFITELFIVKNYGLAVVFFTPNALLIAESMSQGKFTYYASARFIDILTGILIGLIGVFLIGRRSASSRLPHLIAKTIRSQARYILALFTEQNMHSKIHKRESMEMQTNMNNMKTLYDTALGEIPVHKKALEYYWPVILFIEQLGYLLESYSKRDDRPIIPEKSLVQLLYVLETMALSTSIRQPPIIINIPEIKEYPSLEKEIRALQRSLQVNS